MRHVDNIALEERDLARASYQEGLRETFQPTHEPPPQRMRQALQALWEREERTPPNP